MVEKQTLAEEREATAAGLFHGAADGVPRISPEELAARQESSNPPIVLDVRSRSSYERDRAQIPGSERVTPDRVGEWAVGRSPQRSIVTYCT
jgi:rhodanese-related sulfurtransferase